MTASSSPRKFAAFISYRHLDNTDEGRRWAEWLHHWIESYRVPRPLVGAKGEFGSVPPRVAPVFRDEWEMRGGGELAMLIEEGLRGSECLIVLCTPRSAVSPWVIDEVTKFKALGKEHRIIPVLIEGEPGVADAASDDTERAARECLPATLRRGVRAVGPPTADGLYPLDETAPLALTPCDFRPKGTHDMGYTNAAAYRESLERAGVPKQRHRDLEERYAERLRLERLRIMSGLLGVSLDELNQRDAAERARRWRLLFFLSAAVVAVIVLLGLAVWVQSARRQRLLVSASDRDHAAAEQALVEDDWPLAVAYLDRALTYWPQNQDAASLLWSLLRYGPAADALAPRQRHALEQPVQGLAWSPDSQRLLIRLAAGELRVLDVAAGRFVEPSITIGEVPEICEWTRDGSALYFTTAAGGWWRASPPTMPPMHIAATSARPLVGCPLSPDGKQIVARTNDGAIRIFDAATGKPVIALEIPATPGPAVIPRAAWRPDGRAVLVETPVGSTPSLPGVQLLLREFSTETGRPAAWTIPSKRPQTAGLSYSPSGRYALVHQGATTREITGASAAQLEFYEQGTLVDHTRESENYTWHPRADEVFLWGHMNLARRRPPTALRGTGPTYDLADPESVALDAAGAMLVIGSELGENATLFDVARFKTRARWEGGAGLSAWHSLSPDGRWWAVALKDTELILCRVPAAFFPVALIDPNAHPLPQPVDQQAEPDERGGWQVAFAKGDELAIRRASTRRLTGSVTTLAQMYRAVRFADAPRRIVCTASSGAEFSIAWEPPGCGDQAIQQWALAIGGKRLSEAGAPEKMEVSARIAAWQTIIAHQPREPAWRALLDWWRTDRPLPKEPQ